MGLLKLVYMLTGDSKDDSRVLHLHDSDNGWEEEEEQILEQLS